MTGILFLFIYVIIVHVITSQRGPAAAGAAKGGVKEDWTLAYDIIVDIIVHIIYDIIGTMILIEMETANVQFAILTDQYNNASYDAGFLTEMI